MHRNTKAFPNNFIVIFIVLFSLIVACKNKEQAPIEVSKMKDILTDVHLAEAYSSLIVKDSVQKKVFNKNIDSLALFYKIILNKHQVTLTQFDEALQWYSLHPQLLDTAYASVVPILERMKSASSNPIKK